MEPGQLANVITAALSAVLLFAVILSGSLHVSDGETAFESMLSKSRNMMSRLSQKKKKSVHFAK